MTSLIEEIQAFCDGEETGDSTEVTNQDSLEDSIQLMANSYKPKKSRGDNSSQYFRSGSQGFLNGLRHYYESSSEESQISIEPGSAGDLSQIMKILNKRKSGGEEVKFAVKGAGHTSNPGFSSTTGIQISMSRFTKLSHNVTDGELTVGAGCTFDEIYKYILPRGYNIVGGGGSVGIGGWMLGGGYSLKINQYGLGIDNLVRAKVVLPDGEIMVARDRNGNERVEGDRKPWELLKAIKGGGNNFGVVTEFVLKTHFQGLDEDGHVYGGTVSYDKPRFERVKSAILAFIKKSREGEQEVFRKTSIVAAFRFYRNQGVSESKLTVLAYYDGKKPASDPFDDFLAIPHHGELEESAYKNIDQDFNHYDGPTDDIIKFLNAKKSYHHAWNLASLSSNSSKSPSKSKTPGLGTLDARARWGNVMVFDYTKNLIDVVEEEAKAAKRLMERHGGKMIVADLWPHLPSMFPSKDISSAWPSYREKPIGPLLVYFVWEGEENDGVWIKQMKIALDHIRRTALAEGCTTTEVPIYSNTCLEALDEPGKKYTTVEDVYRSNLEGLSKLRKIYDPNQVMNGAGGFRIPFPQSGDE